MNKLIRLLFVFIFLCFICFGWIGNEVYRSLSNKRILDGLYIRNANYSEASSEAYGLDKGDWVCINVKGMEYERAVEVCNHEAGHEIFAEICEKNITKCMGVLE